MLKTSVVACGYTNRVPEGEAGAIWKEMEGEIRRPRQILIKAPHLLKSLNL